jgi:hypothetical protein
VPSFVRLFVFVLYHIAIKKWRNGYKIGKNVGEIVAVVQSIKSVLK